MKETNQNIALAEFEGYTKIEQTSENSLTGILATAMFVDGKRTFISEYTRDHDAFDRVIAKLSPIQAEHYFYCLRELCNEVGEDREQQWKAYFVKLPLDKQIRAFLKAVGKWEE